MWRSLVSRLVRVQEAVGSNPATPTKKESGRFLRPLSFLVSYLSGGIRTGRRQDAAKTCRWHVFSPRENPATPTKKESGRFLRPLSFLVSYLSGGIRTGRRQLPRKTVRWTVFQPAGESRLSRTSPCSVAEPTCAYPCEINSEKPSDHIPDYLAETPTRKQRREDRQRGCGFRFPRLIFQLFSCALPPSPRRIPSL